jgi:hypothetical protein
VLPICLYGVFLLRGSQRSLLTINPGVS